jgi:hypothetical protein
MRTLRSTSPARQRRSASTPREEHSAALLPVAVAATPVLQQQGKEQQGREEQLGPRLLEGPRGQQQQQVRVWVGVVVCRQPKRDCWALLHS